MKNRKYKYFTISAIANIAIMHFVLIVPNSALFAKTVLFLPEEIELEDVNKNTNKKLVNRYKNEDQIKNQYKGKLKYKPDNDGLNMYRDGRFYTSIYFLPKLTLKGTIDDSGIDNYKSNNSYSVSVGYYFNNNIAMEIDYSELAYSVSNLNLGGILNGFKMHFKNYFLNVLVESNYSRFIPFASMGFGIIQSDFNESNVANIKGHIAAAYQFIGGFEIAFTDSLLLSFRYKFFKNVNKIKLRYGDSSHNINLKGADSFNIGFKYVW